MAPHRTNTLSSLAPLLRPGFIVPPDPGAGVAAGLLALGLAFWNLHTVVFFGLVVVGGAVDLWTGSARARANDRLKKPNGFDRARLREGMWGKAIDLAIALFYGVTIDVVFTLIGGWADLGITDIFQTHTPGTAAMLLWLLLKEWESIKENRENTPGGAGRIAPLVVKVIDILRWWMKYPGKPFPAERWRDNRTPEQIAWADAMMDVSPEERAWIQEQLDGRRSTKPPPAAGD